MFSNIKPSLAPRMVSKADRDNLFCSMLEDALPGNLDATGLATVLVELTPGQKLGLKGKDALLGLLKMVHALI